MNLAVSPKQGKVLSFGELLLRICPDAEGQWLNNNTLPFYIGGAELNVATALALWGIPSKYFTALPDNGMSAQLLNHLNKMGIDTSAVYHHGNRLGIFYLTKGQDMKHDALIYDRAHSAFAELQLKKVDWDKVLEEVSWLHFSAICPAIGQNIADVCSEVLEAASAKRITISVDLNYRAKLWQYGKTPKQIMPNLVRHCDLVMGNIWAAEAMLGIPVLPDIHGYGKREIYLQEAQKTSERIMEQYPKCKAVANTFRFDSAGDIRYYTTLFTDQQLFTSSVYESDQIIDKVGSGDCFMAGLIYGFYKGLPPQETIEFATAAAFKKLFIPSDATTISVEEIQNAMKK